MAPTPAALNRYNWFGQRLLVHQDHQQLEQLRRQLARPDLGRPLSDHLTYVHCCRLLKTGGPQLAGAVLALQGLDFDTNARYFELLCQCLLYTGNHDSLVALCRQHLKRRVEQASAGHDEAREQLLDAIQADRLLGEARLWLLFGRALQHQRQFRDAGLAYSAAARLGRGSGGARAALCCARFRLPDYRAAVKALAGAHRLAAPAAAAAQPPVSQNRSQFALASQLALLLAAQPVAGCGQLHKAAELLRSLELQQLGGANPALAFNRLAARCQPQAAHAPLGPQRLQPRPDFGEPQRCHLEHLGARSYVTFNSLLVQAHSAQPPPPLDSLVDALRGSEAACWSAGALWNNLGLCYLAKQRSVAAFSCLLRAVQLSPLEPRAHLNLALAFIQVDLSSRALPHLLASRFLQRSSALPDEASCDPSIDSLLAICYERLGAPDEARRLHMLAARLPPALGGQDEALAGGSQPHKPANPLALVNYAIFLYNSARLHQQRQQREQNFKLASHLLDLLEQQWLQRNQNDAQFSAHLLTEASRVGDKLRTRHTAKTYAWTRHGDGAP